MGTGCSRLGSRPSRARTNRTNSSMLCSLLCGGSNFRATHQMEDDSAEFLVNSAENRNLLVNDVQNPTYESSLISSKSTGLTSTSTGSTISYESIVPSNEDMTIEDGPRNVQEHRLGKCLSESKELVPSHQVSGNYNHGESCKDSGAMASTSSKDQPSSNPVSVNVTALKNAVNNIGDSVKKGASQTCNGDTHPCSSSTEDLGNFHSNGLFDDIQAGEGQVVDNLGSNPVPNVSDTPDNFQSLEDESSHEGMPPGLGLVVSNREHGEGESSVLHVDVLSFSPNILSDINPDSIYYEARRNSTRLFWDAFSRRSSRRHSDSPSQTAVFSRDTADDVTSNDRWLLDWSGGFFDDENAGDSRRIGSRIHSLNERRRHARSEIWERLRSGHSGRNRRNSSCPSGIHPDGACSCEPSLMTEDSSAHSSISRIVMLAEALFEVLDEIHRQPVSFSLSMVSLPAPESIVDSFPLKNHKKVDTPDGRDEVEQCYICLAEYEEGDRIRVLPCHHEYHMSCVDKWLKEIHGVCPLCRGDVCEGFDGCSISNSGVPLS